MGVSIPGVYFYILFKTTAPDKSAFFGIHRTENPSYGQDGLPVTYLGTGKKLQDKVKQYGIHSLTYDVLKVCATHGEAAAELAKILTPATMADPRCLNMPIPSRGEKISEALTDLPKSPEHKEHISLAMQGNDNALGHVKSEETREVIAESKSKVKWYHNKKTGEEIQLEQDEEALTGFELGRLPKELHSRFKKDRKVVLSDSERARLIPD